MASMKDFKATFGEKDEIAFMSRNDMKLAVFEEADRIRFYTYTTDDSFRERVGRFLHDGITQLWDDEHLIDLHVKVGAKLFKCHGVVLASVSDFFKAELKAAQKGTGQPARCNTITLDENYVPPRIFQLLLDQFYKGNDALTHDNAMALMNAASYLKIKAMELRCSDVIIKQLGQKSCMNIWDWAERYNFPYIASKAKFIVLTNFKVLRHTQEFMEIPMERLTMILGHEQLQYRNEDDVLEAVLDWVQYDKKDREQHLKDLLPFVCFPFLSTSYINQLRKHDLIGLQTEFAQYVDDALLYHLAASQKDGRKMQRELLGRQAQALTRVKPDTRRVAVLIGGQVVEGEPITNVVACYFDKGHAYSRYRDILQFSIASLPQSVGLHFASSMWMHEIYVSGGSRSPDTLFVYKPFENAWHTLKPMPQGLQNHAMVSLNRKLYILGGRTTAKDGEKIVSVINEYNIESSTWRQSGTLPVAVEAAPAATMSHKIYVFGGRTATDVQVGIVQCLDTQSGHTSIVGELPTTTEGAKAISLGKDIILVCPDGSVFKIEEPSKKTELEAVQSSDDEEEHFLYNDETLSIVRPDEVVSSDEVCAGMSSEASPGKRRLSTDSSSEQTERDDADQKPELTSKDFDDVSSRNHREASDTTGDKCDTATTVPENGSGKHHSDEVRDENNQDKKETSDPGEMNPGSETESVDKSTTRVREGKSKECQVIIKKIASIEKRRDFGLFIRKADVMVVGGQSENGHFLDDILRIHVPTGHVCNTDTKLNIPLSGMQVESTAINHKFLLQFFDATSCF